MDVFSDLEKERIGVLMSNPQKYYELYVPKESDKINKMSEADMIRNSTTFKVGKVIMFVPIKIKLAIKKLMGK